MVESASEPHAVELLLWSGCPSGPEARELLTRALDELGRTDLGISERFIEDYEVAQTERFLGSPSIRVDDAEAVSGLPGQGYGLTCRIYHKADGRISPLPEYADLLLGLRQLLD